ncbi:ImmA/IrrE family metallo-endopeptidase [Nocardia farcinica]|uniref:ImmA/IrrE family metallo-endopeptidase n=1 Tax=Nocardia farcinica TaxID=37329 RepID=UPI001894B908|nr:ImmA/IrrE family metallo-endopeptidase [Nocardia farcinica]MBF6185037.1 ImmA/IrrE family metallo-endopeptidase [Nocardia farcinica]MBF6363995.1 ImmA/IrrE family metallo-endopeptidase [Nocardia farcinica]
MSITTTSPHANVSSSRAPRAAPPGSRRILAQLRELVPDRPVSATGSLRLARQQADSLLHAHSGTDPAPIDLITESPRIRVEYALDQQMPRASFWDMTSRQWVIQLRWADSWKHQRFHIAHEFKHILDHGHELTLYPNSAVSCGACDAEHVADYFARYLLVPDRALRRAWRTGLTSISELADHFTVADDVIQERLRDIGYDHPAHPGAKAHRHSKSSLSRHRSTAG